ncbi:MAG: hypothetical protein M3306_15335 [Actinomycetota bacterium]|nr:hypothetical protein [Actinomycetota bacterium]
MTTEPYEPSMVPERVVVPAGESVTAVIDWQAMSTANDPDVTTDLRVTALPGGKPVTVAVSWPGAPSDLDILDGAEVRISPWAQALRADPAMTAERRHRRVGAGQRMVLVAAEVAVLV